MKILDLFKTKIRGTMNIDKLKKDGLIVGNNFHAMEGVVIDAGHCWLIEIGNNVTLAPRVQILAHDASTKKILNYTRIGCVTIGDNVFIGAGSIILPNVTIASNSVIGAGCVVTKNIDSGVWGGNPCKLLCSYEEFIEKQNIMLENLPRFDEKWLYANITSEMKIKMKLSVKKNSGGFII